jgi:hypothetical protein
MTKKIPQLSPLYYGFTGFFLLMFLGFFYYLLSNTKFVNLTIEILFQMGFTLFVLMLPYLVIFWLLYREALTEFKDHEIIHYNLIGETRIPWDDAVSLEESLLKLRIKSKEGKTIVVHLAIYKNSNAVTEFIREKIKHNSIG